MLTKTPVRRPEIFKHLRDSQLRRMMAISKPENCKAGEIIFSAHDIGDKFFGVESGRVRIFTQANRREKTLAYIEAGDFFGEMALLDGKHRSASAQALVDTKLMVVNKTAFRKLLADTDFTIKLLDTLTRRLREADREIESLLFQNMLGRLARAIIKLAGPEKTHKASLHMTLRELANYIGTTREPLSRAMASLKRCGLIDYQEKTLQIKNYRRLAAIGQN